jgi:hypothetical protein
MGTDPHEKARQQYELKRDVGREIDKAHQALLTPSKPSGAATTADRTRFYRNWGQDRPWYSRRGTVMPASFSL